MNESDFLKQQRELDEARTTICDHFPKVYRGLYDGLLSEGFDEQQSLKLLQTYILSQCPHGVNGVE